MGTPNDQYAQPPRNEEADMVAAVTRLEQQFSFVYNIIQGQRQEFQHITETVGRLRRDMEGIVAFMECIRDDLRPGRFLHRAMDQGLYDPADVEVLATLIANVTTRVNSVDNLETKIQLTKQCLQRLETQIANNGPGPLLSDAASRAAQQRYEALRAQQTQQTRSRPVPTMRPGAALPSEHGHPPAPALESRPTLGSHPGQDRHLSGSEKVQQASPQPGFRAVELHLPPPAALCRWRPAESYSQSGQPPPPSSNDLLRLHPPRSESQAGGLAAVNLSQASKRPRDEHQPQHDPDQHELLKRPKLATLPPLKPRRSFYDDRHQCLYVQQAQMNPARQARGRVPSGENPIRPHSHPAPGQRATNSHRFITSTGQPDNQENRRATSGDPAVGALFEHSTTGATGRGRGCGNSGKRRGSLAAGSRGSSGPTNIPPPASEAPKQEHLRKQVLAEWREHQLAAAQQATTNRHYPRQHTYSRIAAARPSPAHLSVNTSVPPHSRPCPAGQEHEFSATPAASNVRPYSMVNGLDSVDKKPRRKPIRNSDGVLIRKDGLPDMRSVSSANNLPKPHRKDEKDSTQLELSAKRVASEPLLGKAAS
jgi:hypothetical protein